MAVRLRQKKANPTTGATAPEAPRHHLPPRQHPTHPLHRLDAPDDLDGGAYQPPLPAPQQPQLEAAVAEPVHAQRQHKGQVAAVLGEGGDVLVEGGLEGGLVAGAGGQWVWGGEGVGGCRGV